MAVGAIDGRMVLARDLEVGTSGAQSAGGELQPLKDVPIRQALLSRVNVCLGVIFYQILSRAGHQTEQC